MVRKIALMLSILGWLVAFAPTVQAERRVALVIGNNAYASLPKLFNAVFDARAIAQALEQLGFRVFKGENLDYKAANRLHADFESAISAGDTAFVFFAGHGVALGGENYLLPTDTTKPKSGEENLVRSEAHSVDMLIRRVQGRGAAASFFVVDACRDNPFETAGVRSIGATAGLARVDAPTGVFVLFSAGIGQTALDRLSQNDKTPNSVFVRTFVPLLTTPGLTHLALAKRVQTEVKALALRANHQQQPAFYDQIDGELIFREGTSPAGSPPNTALAARQSDREPQADLADMTARVIDAVAKLKVRTPPPPPAAGQKPYDKPKDDKPNYGHGSGFIIDPSGVLVVNDYMVADALAITVTLSDGTALPGEVIGRDSKTELALVQVRAGKPLPWVKFGDSETLRVGERVVTIGHPYGLDSTVTAGMVTGLKRDFNYGPYDEFIQTDIFFRGMSGSPLLNLNGEVVGINTAAYGTNPDKDKIGLAVPSRLAVPVIDQLRQHGRVSRGWLGVRMQAVTMEMAEALGLTGARGALVTRVDGKGPAKTAGISNGDVIVRINGNEVKDSRDVSRFTEQLLPGTSVELAILRGGKAVTKMVTLMRLSDAAETAAVSTPAAAKPELPPGSPFEELFEEFFKNRRNAGSSAAPADVAINPQSGLPDRTARGPFGLEVASLTPSLRQRYRINDNLKGVVVTDVPAQSEAASKKLVAGDVIVEVASNPVASPDELQRRIAQARTESRKAVLLLVANANGEYRFLLLNIR
jgi:serine protease Do